MNRTTRSTLALLLAICLMMAVFAGCTSKSSTETVTLLKVLRQARKRQLLTPTLLAWIAR